MKKAIVAIIGTGALLVFLAWAFDAPVVYFPADLSATNPKNAVACAGRGTNWKVQSASTPECQKIIQARGYVAEWDCATSIGRNSDLCLKF